MQRFLQLALDLFDTAMAAPAEAVPGPPPTARSTDKPTASPPVAGPPAESLDTVLTPASFAHPQANRKARLQGTLVGYEFKRARRKTIGFSVGVEGLVVSAPRWVSMTDVDAALAEKAGWIVRKLEEQRQRHERVESSRIEWKDGASFPFLGEAVIVVIDPRQSSGGGANAVLNTETSALPGVPHLTLHLGLSHNAGPEQIRDAAQAWLMRQARRIFIERLDHFAPSLGVQWKKLSLSSASTRWGSASADGSIRLNWRLVHFRLPVIDYVVAHELSHLRVMDHSPRFWETVESVVPEYAQLKSQLKDDLLPPW